MLQRDYIMRLVEQLVRVLTDSIGLTKTRDYEGGLRVLDGAFRDFFGWSSDFVNAMPDEALLELLKRGGTLETGACLLLANLLKGEGDIYAAKGDRERSYHRYLKALHLFLAAFEHDPEGPVPLELDQAAPLIESLMGYQLPLATRSRLFPYLEARGDYARAEDLLHELLAEGGVGVPSVQEGIAFYQRLLARSDEELLAGRLSRQEVQEGMEELRGL